jgi:hypothetical protein
MELMLIPATGFWITVFDGSDSEDSSSSSDNDKDKDKDEETNS